MSHRNHDDGKAESDLALEAMKAAGYVSIRGIFQSYTLGHRAIVPYDVPDHRRGALLPFRRKPVRVVCVENTGGRVFLAEPVG